MNKISIKDRHPMDGEKVLVEFDELGYDGKNTGRKHVDFATWHDKTEDHPAGFLVGLGRGILYVEGNYWCPMDDIFSDSPTLIEKFLKRYNDFSKLTFGQSRFLRYSDGKWEVMEPDLHPIPPVLHVAYRGPNLAKALNVLAGGDPGQYIAIESNSALDQKP